jgi:oligopeptidase A
MLSLRAMSADTLTNPLLVRNALPNFDAISPEHVGPAVSSALANAEQRVEQLRRQSQIDFDWALELEDIRQSIGQVFSPVAHLNRVLSSPAMRDAYNDCLPKITEFMTRLGQDPSLLGGYEDLKTQHAVTSDSIRTQLVEHALRDLRLAGIALPPEEQNEFREIMQKLAKTEATFEQNLMDATDAFSWQSDQLEALSGLPESLVATSQANARDHGVSGYRLSLDPPTFTAVMSHATCEALRKVFYAAWVTRASDQGPQAGLWDNTALMEEILGLRHRAAHLLGFDNYAELSLATKMAKSGIEVLEFLEQLASRSRAIARTEFSELEQFAGRPLAAWDVAYFAEQKRQQTLGVDEEALRPYFPLEKVFSGLFRVAENLFGVRFARRVGVACWHKDVRYYDLIDVDEQVLGGMYLDLYARANKRGGAWMDECLNRQDIAGEVIQPVAHLVCNFAAPGKEAPALLTHRDVVTLFHEFGHTLHHLLTEVDYPSLSGINGVPWDAVELPSQFFENFAWLPSVLSWLSEHYQTGEPLPKEALDKLQASRNFHAGLQMVRQLELALFDFKLHTEYDPASGGRVTEILEQVRASVGVVPSPPYNRFTNGFSHIFGGGYAAGYYSYKWAEVLAADTFSAFEQAGPFDASTAKRFRKAILAKGGSRDILDGFVEFMGRTPALEALLRQQGMA